MCRRICVDTGKACSLLLTSPLAASQNFEYKMSNILDKPLEVSPTPPVRFAKLTPLCRASSATSVCFPVHSVPIVTKPCSTAQMAKDPLPPISRVKPCMVAVVMLAFSVSTRYPRSPFAILKFAIVNPMGTNELFVGDRAEYVSRRRSYPVLRNRY